MSQGDVILFNKAVEWIGDGTIDLDTHTFKMGLVTNAVTPTAATAAPAWGAGETTNLSSSQVTPGGNYSTGGPSLSGVGWSESAGTVTFSVTNPSISQHASNPTDARWAIFYSDTATNKNALCAIDLGGITDLSAGGFSLTFPSGVVFTFSAAA